MQGKSIHVGHVMGPLWFLPALWWAKMSIGIINRISRVSLEIALGVGLLSFIAGKWCTDDKFFLLQGLCALPFLAIGQWKRDNNIPWWMLGIGVIAWICAFSFSHVDMHGRDFGCWPLDIMGACGGTWMLFKVVDYIQCAEWMKVIMSPFAWIGRFSLVMLCMHGLEWKALLPIEEMFCEGMPLLVLRFVVTIVLSIMVVYVPGLKKIYS